jgi:hypothetical protein
MAKSRSKEDMQNRVMHEFNVSLRQNKVSSTKVPSLAEQIKEAELRAKQETTDTSDKDALMEKRHNNVIHVINRRFK